METSSAPGVALVVGAGRGIGRDLAVALGRRDRIVAGIAAEDVDLTDPLAVRAAFDAAAAGRPVELVVVAHLEPASFRAGPLVDLGEDGWEATAERSLRAGFVVLQAAHAAIADGGRVVLVLPTSAATGVPGLVPLCAATEGLRVMAKAVARRWGARGVTVNTVEVDLAAFVAGERAEEGVDVPSAVQLGTSALPPGSAVDDVVGVVELLSSPAAGAVTGALLVADRGTVMLP